MAALLEAQLARYATTLRQDDDELDARADALPADELAALRLLRFEKKLLTQALKTLGGAAAVPAAAG